MKLVIGWTVLMVKMFLVAKWNGLIVAIKCGKLKNPTSDFLPFPFLSLSREYFAFSTFQWEEMENSRQSFLYLPNL